MMKTENNAVRSVGPYRSAAATHLAVLRFLESESQPCSTIQFMQIVVLPYSPAPTPKRIAPVACLGGGDVGRRPLRLQTQAKPPAEVVFHAAAQGPSKSSCSCYP